MATGASIILEISDASKRWWRGYREGDSPDQQGDFLSKVVELLPHESENEDEKEALEWSDDEPEGNSSAEALATIPTVRTRRGV